MHGRKVRWWVATILFVAGLLAINTPTRAQTTACDGISCDALQTSICDGGGYTVTLTQYLPAATSPNGTATYIYTICAPAFDGVCSNNNALSCQDHQDCAGKCTGQNVCNNKPAGPDNTCSSDADCAGVCTGGSSTCRVDKFQGLSHFDIFFPELGGVDSCLPAKTCSISHASCDDANPCGPGAGTCVSSVTGDCSSGTFGLGDGNLEQTCGFADRPDNYQALVAKCDNPNLSAGQCLTMTLNVTGETSSLASAQAVVLSKESTDCHESCISGPSCETCEENGGGGAECLTRTIGFWGTHPWITNDYDPVTVCGKTLLCSGASDGKSNPSCLAGSCDSIMEGLGSIGGELKNNSAYVAMVKQLTAAKLNLNATAALVPDATCADWTYQDQTIQQWITTCENLCGGSQAVISSSGCIEALDAFNNSQDTGFLVTPSPFDRPPVDDFGNISGADPTQFGRAQGNNRNDPKFVIGKGQCS